MASSIGTVDAGVVARVSEWGDLEMLDGSAPLRWFVAADDRWHIPSDETAVRQSRIDGAPVFETRLRVPGGDVVQRLWAAVGDGGATGVVIEFENDSRMAVAVALTRRDLVLPRPELARDLGASAPGLELDGPLTEPPLVLPLGHQASIRVALVPRASGWSPTREDGPAFLSVLPGHDAVARGWVSLADRASTVTGFELIGTVPMTERLLAERCDVILTPPGNIFIGGDPVAAAHWLLDSREAHRLGVAHPEPSEVATAVELIVRRTGPKRSQGWDALTAAALRAASDLLASDARAARDLERAVSRSRRRSMFAELAPQRLSIGADLARGAFVTALEESIALPTGPDELTLFPDGLPPERRGVDLEVHHVPVGRGRNISFAVRWHGPNAAVLWEASGAERIVIRTGVDPAWATDRTSGEGLWRLADPARGDDDSFTDPGDLSVDRSFS